MTSSLPQQALYPRLGDATVVMTELAAAKLVMALVGSEIADCGLCVPKTQAARAQIKGSVFHMQRMLSGSRKAFIWAKSEDMVAHSRHKRGVWPCVVLAGVAIGVLQSFVSVSYAEDKECIDFYAVGESKCGTAVSPAVSVSGGPVLVSPEAEKTEKQKVDEYLENYGKPPREFVEFYMNPTPDNAKKWVEAYQGIVQKSQNLSQMWDDAERLYSQQGAEPALRRAAPVSAAPASPVTSAAAPAATIPSAQASQLGNFGGLNGVPVAGQTGGVMPQDRGLKLTYYFSQVCPFCARMTPELAMLTTSYSGKLEFTCVDVTPFSGGTSPNPAYLRDKLACRWRLPEGDELQREGVTQTPTLLVQQGGKGQVKLSGYMSQEQLKPYFAR